MSEEQVFDSWEDFEESGELDRQLDKINKPKDKTVKSQPCILQRPVPAEDSSRTQYQPQLRILKRPSAEASQSQEKNAAPVRPVKTLEEREAAYAEARRRILGPHANSDAAATNDKVVVQARSGAVNNLPSHMERMRIKPDEEPRQPKGPDGSRGFKPR